MDEDLADAILEMRAVVLHSLALRYNKTATLSEIRTLARRVSDEEVLKTFQQRQPTFGWLRTIFNFGMPTR